MSARLVLAAVAALAIPESVRSHEAALSRYNYWEHVRPIFEKHCAGCHRGGGVAPMSLLEYQSAVPWSKAMKLQLLSRTMPPFLPDESNGPFRGARALSAEELDILVDWAVGATPEGKPVETTTAEGSLPEPDVLVDAGSEVVIGEDEYDETECLRFPGFTEARVLSGLTVRSQTPSVLRGAALYLGEACAGGSPVLTWLPDQHRASFPEGMGRIARPGEKLALELRYVKGWNDEGARIVDRPKLGLWFSPRGASVRTREIESKASLSKAPVELVALYADVSMKSVEPLRVTAIEPDGTVRRLLEMEAFDSAWLEKYVFVEPLKLPAGTVIEVSRPGLWVDFIEKP
jgi:hypothetical protein